MSMEAEAAEVAEYAAKLEQMRQSTHDIVPRPPSESELERFLHSCKGNEAKAEHLLRKMLEWRVGQNVDTVLDGEAGEQLNQTCLQYMTYYLDLVDKEARPVAVWNVGRIRSRQLMEGLGSDGTVAAHLWVKEKTMRQSRENLGGRESHTIVCDMEGAVATTRRRGGIRSSGSTLIALCLRRLCCHRARAAHG
eukprot:SAG11_NODE_829_length_6967_cov_7.039196_5_plen_193_part_00